MSRLDVVDGARVGPRRRLATWPARQTPHLTARLDSTRSAQYRSTPRMLAQPSITKSTIRQLSKGIHGKEIAS